MTRWLQLLVVSFASTMLVVMTGVMHRRMTQDLSAPTPIVAQVARTSLSLSLASTDPAPVDLASADSASTSAIVQRRLRDSGWPDALDPEPDLRLSVVSSEWSPPTWYPEEARDGLWTLDSMSQADEPYRRRLRLHSRTVFVYDLESGEVLLSRGADDRFPVASLTKVVSALTLVSEHPDLDREICTDSSTRPSWPGAGSRIKSGTCTTGWDLLGAALVHSDNGAAMAFAPIAGLPHFPFVSRMNQVAEDLHMDQSSF